MGRISLCFWHLLSRTEDMLQIVSLTSDSSHKLDHPTKMGRDRNRVSFYIHQSCILFNDRACIRHPRRAIRNHKFCSHCANDIRVRACLWCVVLHSQKAGCVDYAIPVAFGPLFLGPLSEIYGRSLVLQAANMWYLGTRQRHTSCRHGF